MIDTSGMQFRAAAKALGCPNPYELCDLAVWEFIMKAQGKIS